MKTPRIFLSLLASAAFLVASNLNAATTQAVGYTTWTIEPGTGTGRVFTPLALPLYAPATNVDGAIVGTIAAIDNANNTLTVTSAGWTPGQLSQASSPSCLRITSGSAEGRNLIVSTTTSNTSDTVTIDLVASEIEDLQALSLATGTDTFELVNCDTFGSLLGDPTPGGFIGGATADDADQIWYFYKNSLDRLYYDTDLGYWTKEVARGGQPDLSNQPIPSDAGLLVYRLAAQTSEIIISGTVPDTARQVTIASAGLTFFGSAWPVDMALSEAGISQIEGWQNSASSSDPTGGDTVIIFSGGNRTEYFYDGTNWRRNAGRTQPISDSDIIPAGSCVIISKTTPYTSDVVLNQDIPYTL